MTQPLSPPPFPAMRATVIFTGVTAAVGLLVGVVLVLLHREAWIAPATGPAIACLAGAVVSVLLVAMAARQGMGQVPLVVLAGMVVRLAFAILGAAVLVLGLAMDRSVVIPATIAWYIVLLVAETRFFANYFKSFPSAGPLPAAPEEAPSC